MKIVMECVIHYLRHTFTFKFLKENIISILRRLIWGFLYSARVEVGVADGWIVIFEIPHDADDDSSNELTISVRVFRKRSSNS